MKILIVEDEIKTLNGIERLIEQLGEPYDVVGKGRNGLEGIELALREKPDLIMTDIRMGEMDGLEMIKQLNDRRFTCKYLILSGYADFQYAREAMTLGSVDYLLKPMTKDMLKEALCKIDGILEHEKASIRVSSYSTQELFERVFLAPEISGPVFRTEIGSRFEEGEELHLLLVKGENRFVDAVKKQIVEQLRQGMDPDRMIVCAQKGSQEIYVLIRGGERAAVKGLIDRQIQRLYRDGLDDMVCSFHSFRGIENLEDAGKRVRDNAGWSLTLGRGRIVSDELIRGLSIQKLVYPSNLEQAIIRRINSGELEEVEKDIQAFVQFLSDKTYACADIREALVCLTVAVLYAIRKASYGVYENISHLNLMDWIRQLLFTDHYIRIMMNVLMQYRHYHDGLHHNTHPLVQKALRIIDLGYQGELSLEEIAGGLNVTPEYLSTLFIRELGIKFTTYCTQRRIECAKHLLADPNRKIYEVAAESGYGDVKYFCKVFKKYTGLSPGEYQKNQS